MSFSLLAGIDAEIASARRRLGRDSLVELPATTVTVVGSASIAAVGPGPARAAMNTQSIIDRFSPAAVVLLGTAGAISGTYSLFDVVVAAETIDYDLDLRGVGLQRGAEPGRRSNDGATVRRPGARLLEVSLDAISSALPDVAVHRGRVLSGGVVVTPRLLRERQELVGELAGDAVDMESAAVALVAEANGIPWVSIRVVSDLPGAGETAVPFRERVRDASEVIAAVAEALAGALESRDYSF